MVFEDLAPCDYFGIGSAAVLRSVGWLGREHQFQTGAVDRQVFDTLKDLCASLATIHIDGIP